MLLDFQPWTASQILRDQHRHGQGPARNPLFRQLKLDNGWEWEGTSPVYSSRVGRSFADFPSERRLMLLSPARQTTRRSPEHPALELYQYSHTLRVPFDLRQLEGTPSEELLPSFKTANVEREVRFVLASSSSALSILTNLVSRCF
jgi:hypothetical protein